MLEVLLKIAVFIVVIGVLIAVHEFGHFIVAKWCRVGVLRFSVGFGPAIFRRRIGETEYQIGAIPLGGFVRMVGDIPDMITGTQATDDEVRSGQPGSTPEVDEEEFPPEVQSIVRDRTRWFVEQSLARRSAIVVAGPLFNVFFAIFAFTIVAALYGEFEVETKAVVGRVMNGSPAASAGLQAGDLLLQIGQTEVSTWSEMAREIHAGSDSSIEVTALRDDQVVSLVVEPQRKSIIDSMGQQRDVYMIGIEPVIHERPVPLWKSPYVGSIYTLNVTLQTYKGLWGMVTGKVSAKDLAGPVFIFDVAGEQAKKGLQSLLSFMAILSVSLAILNLLPIPVLDGGHLMFFAIEAIIGPISFRKKEIAQQVGLVLLLSLMVFAVHNDISRDIDLSKPQVTWEESGE